MALTREELLKPDVVEKDIGSGTICIRILTAGDLFDMEDDDPCDMLFRSVCDDEGNLLFKDKDEARGISVKSMRAILEFIKEANGLDIGEQEGN